MVSIHFVSPFILFHPFGTASRDLEEAKTEWKASSGIEEKLKRRHPQDTGMFALILARLQNVTRKPKNTRDRPRRKHGQLWKPGCFSWRFFVPPTFRASWCGVFNPDRFGIADRFAGLRSSFSFLFKAGTNFFLGLQFFLGFSGNARELKIGRTVFHFMHYLNRGCPVVFNCCIFKKTPSSA